MYACTTSFNVTIVAKTNTHTHENEHMYTKEKYKSSNK